MNKKNYIIFLIITFLLIGCGYKAIDKSILKEFQLKELEFSGNKKIGFLIKNNLTQNFISKKEGKPITLKIGSIKEKSIKEKNLKNQIIKYKISLVTTVNINFVSDNKKENFIISLNGSYNVDANHAGTISNQNNMENLLAQKTSQQIRSKLILLINDY